MSVLTYFFSYTLLETGDLERDGNVILDLSTFLTLISLQSVVFWITVFVCDAGNNNDDDEAAAASYLANASSISESFGRGGWKFIKEKIFNEFYNNKLSNDKRKRIATQQLCV